MKHQESQVSHCWRTPRVVACSDARKVQVQVINAWEPSLQPVKQRVSSWVRSDGDWLRFCGSPQLPSRCRLLAACGGRPQEVASPNPRIRTLLPPPSPSQILPFLPSSPSHPPSLLILLIRFFHILFFYHPDQKFSHPDHRDLFFSAIQRFVNWNPPI